MVTGDWRDEFILYKMVTWCLVTITMVMGRGGRRFPMGDPHLPWDGYRNIQK
jgi:hypothetical protein